MTEQQKSKIGRVVKQLEFMSGMFMAWDDDVAINSDDKESIAFFIDCIKEELYSIRG